MPVQMIESEEVTAVELSDESLEAIAGFGSATVPACSAICALPTSI